MLDRYRKLYRTPGSKNFSVAGLVARFPMSFVGLSTVMLIQDIYTSYKVAGIVNACGIIGFASAAPLLSRLVDRFGQAQVMRPSITISISSTIIFIFVALSQGPIWLLGALAAISGAFSGSIGAMVRSRWSHVLNSPADLKAAFALESAIDELVCMTGPVIATLLITTVHPASGMILTAGFLLVGGTWFFSQKATQPPPAGHPAEGARTSAMRSGAMWAIGMMFVGAGAIFGSVDVAIVRFTKASGVPWMAGILLALMAAGSLLGALAYGAREWKLPIYKLHLIWTGLLGVGITLVLFPSSLAFMGIVLFVSGIAISPNMTNGYSIVEQIVPRNRLTESLTWMNTFMNLGLALGTSIGGAAVDRFGYIGGLTVSVIAAWFAFVVSALTYRTIRDATEVNSRGHKRPSILRRITRKGRNSKAETVSLTGAELEERAGVVNPAEEVRRYPTSFNEPDSRI
ncbi:MFS transporter [Actinomycetaceae bacterium TAE3-ERU4]|nr:MFS transporter [Actinomycetaceae bacterium TAE3-ERU4]